jgi:beta-glucosidase
VEWSRIQPTPDRWNEDALDIYHEMLRGLHDRGMAPLITLHHFSEPLWLYERGGWENPETPALFEKFVRKVVETLKEYCSMWIPINEPNVFVHLAFIDGVFPPGKHSLPSAFAAMTNMVRGHVLAYRAIKSIQREARVGTSQNIRWMKPAHDWSPADKYLANLTSKNFNAAFLDALVDGKLNFMTKTSRVPEAIGTQDFVGLNYYTTELVSFNLLRPKDFFSNRYFARDALLSETGFIAHEPEGLFEAIKWARGYQQPILITENGVDDADDRIRPRYLVEHLHQIWRAIQFNWPVKGYFHWSLVDNFEWERGWSQRFGLWGLDTSTQARIHRGSVDLYAAICKENAISADALVKYAPESAEKLLPG